MRVRRRRICIIQIADQLVPDLGALFSGDLKLQSDPSAEFLCPINGERISLNPEQLATLAKLPAGEWVDADTFLAEHNVDPENLRSLLQQHVVLSDMAEDTKSKHTLEAEDRMQRIGWYDLTAVYHAMTRWSGMADDVATREHTHKAHRERLIAMEEKYGIPPTHFPRRADALSTHALDVPTFNSALADILRARRTTRVYDREKILPKEELSRVLYGCFGAQGTKELAPGATAVKRTSPSGGGLTPIDPYLFVFRVEGLVSGIYHYDMSRHVLELLREVPEGDLRDLLMEVTAGQDYFTGVQAAVIHVARFDRHHWKYRSHAKAYKALLMDSAHLSQTFYLLATERGLGAFFTAAINDVDLGAELALDPLESAPIGISGLGIRGEEIDTALHFMPETYVPGPDCP